MRGGCPKRKRNVETLIPKSLGNGNADDKVLVATTGCVLVNVDATNGPIQIGDLLVTSDRKGFAMKSLPVEIGDSRIHRPGTLIGKALEPLASGKGKNPRTAESPVTQVSNVSVRCLPLNLLKGICLC